MVSRAAPCPSHRHEALHARSARDLARIHDDRGAPDDQLAVDGRVRLGWEGLSGMSVPPGRKYGAVDSLSRLMT